METFCLGLQGLGPCCLLREPGPKGGLTTCMVGKTPVGSPGGDGVIVITVEKNEGGLLNGGKDLGGGK